MLRILPLVACLLLTGLPVRAADTLRLYFIDMEGGQATLVVSPSGESLLVDTGWLGFDGRDAARIAATAAKAGVKTIDYLVITHYHDDHVGGLEQFAARMKFRTLITHGPNTETNPNAAKLSQIYRNVVTASGATELVVKPGDVIPIKGVNVQVLASNRQLIDKPLAGAGQSNPACEGVTPKRADTSDNSASVGMLMTFGRFRFLDIGDLTQDLEYQLACPVNRIGTIDLYLTTHHGSALSNAEVLVHALHPRVAVMNNGARKGGDLSVLQTVRRSPGLEDLWTLHYSVAGGAEGNISEERIANPSERPGSDGADQGFGISVSAENDGSFVVTNARNQLTKRYQARR